MLVTISDTETGGFTQEHSVLSVGALVGNVDTGEVIDGFESLVKLPSLSDYNVTQGALEVNGLSTLNCFKYGQTPSEIADRLVDLHLTTGSAVIGGHNFEYDVRMLCKHIFDSCTNFEFDSTFGYRKIDSSPIIRLLQGVEGIKATAKLGDAAKGMKIDTSNFDKTCGKMFTYEDRKSGFHGALFDSYVTFLILCKFRRIMTTPDNTKLFTSV